MLLKYAITSTSLALILLSSPSVAKNAEVKAYCKSLIGQDVYLKIDVVKIFEGFKNTDATNIYPTGEVIYRKSYTVTPDPRVFVSEIGRQALAKNKDWYISLLEKGTQVSIHKVEVKGAEVQIEFTRHSGRRKKDYLELPQQTVRLKFDKGYGLDDVKTAFARGFGTERFESVIELTQGMSEADIVDLVGVKPWVSGH